MGQNDPHTVSIHLCACCGICLALFIYLWCSDSILTFKRYFNGNCQIHCQSFKKNSMILPKSCDFDLYINVFVADSQQLPYRKFAEGIHTETQLFDHATATHRRVRKRSIENGQLSLPFHHYAARRCLSKMHWTYRSSANFGPLWNQKIRAHSPRNVGNSLETTISPKLHHEKVQAFFSFIKAANWLTLSPIFFTLFFTVYLQILS